jgi:hypothetical protein
MYKFQDQLKAVEGIMNAGLLAHKESFIYSVLLPESYRLVGFIPTNGELCFSDYSDPELAPFLDKIKSSLSLAAKS